jgi:hypothetical protein
MYSRVPTQSKMPSETGKLDLQTIRNCTKTRIVSATTWKSPQRFRWLKAEKPNRSSELLILIVTIYRSSIQIPPVYCSVSIEYPLYSYAALIGDLLMLSLLPVLYCTPPTNTIVNYVEKLVSSEGNLALEIMLNCSSGRRTYANVVKRAYSQFDQGDS